MKKLLITTLILIFGNANATSANGTISDISIRAQDSMMFVKVSNHIAGGGRPACATWDLSLGLKMDTDAKKALYTLLLTAKTSGETVYIQGTGQCLNETGAEEIKEVNIGPFGN